MSNFAPLRLLISGVAVLLLHLSTGWCADIGSVSDGTAFVNGKSVKAKLFTFDAYRSEQGRMSDPLVVSINETGSVKIYARVSQADHLFGSGEVTTFIGLLEKGAKAAKIARFKKQAGNFRIGTVGGGLTLTMSTWPGGDLKHFSLHMNNPEGDIVEDVINQEVLIGLIRVLSRSQNVINELSGETKDVKIIKLSMGRPGEKSGEGGLTLKIINEQGAALLTVEQAEFKLRVSQKNRVLARDGLSRALQYLRSANKTFEDVPDKKFKISGLGKPFSASIEKSSGNADRYLFTADIVGDGEDKSRWVVIDEEQLAKLIASLGH